MFGRSAAPAAPLHDDGLGEVRRSAFNILPGGVLPTHSPVTAPVPLPIAPAATDTGAADAEAGTAPADERTLDAMEALEGFAFRSTGMPATAAPGPAQPDSEPVAPAEAFASAPTAHESTEHESAAHESTAVLVPADDKPAKGRLRPAFGLRRRRDKNAPVDAADAAVDTGTTAAADAVITDAPAASEAISALPTPPPFDPTQVATAPFGGVPTVPPMEAVTDLPAAPDFVPDGLGAPIASGLPPAYDDAFATDVADMVATDPSAPYVEGDLVDDDVALLPPPFTGAVAVPSFAPAMPAQMSFAPVGEDVVAHVAAQVSAQHLERTVAMEQAHEARQSDAVWQQPAAAPQHEVQGFGATAPGDGGPLSGLAPEHLLEPTPVQTLLEPTGLLQAAPATPVAPSSGLVFADGTVADLGTSPELAALQQAAFALTDPREDDGRH